MSQPRLQSVLRVPSSLERFVTLRERGGSVDAEVRGHVTTFSVMTATLVVNPVIVSVGAQGRGPECAATATKTALAAGVMTLTMGVLGE
jgi:AGZA family xanthine/uracil permease-like MFS transporter